MKVPRWFEPGAEAPTALGTVLSLLSAPLGGLGLMFILFGGWIPGVAMMLGAGASWMIGRHLIAR